MKHIKKNILLTLILVFILIFPYIAGAKAIPKLETTYPSLPPFATATPIAPGSSNSLSTYVIYAFGFIIILSAIIAVVMIAIGGVEYIYSAGNPAVMSNAKSKIFSSVLGLVILACSYLILDTINPNLTRIEDPTVAPISASDISFGVWACKARVDFIGIWNMIGNYRAKRNSYVGTWEGLNNETRKGINEMLQKEKKVITDAQKAIYQYCYLVKTAGPVEKGFEGQVRFFYLVPEYNVREFGVIAYRPGEGRAKSLARVIYGNPTNYNPELTKPIEWPALDGKNDYLRPFELINNPPTDWYADLYELVHMNQAAPDAKKYHCETRGKRETWCDLSSLSPTPEPPSSSPGDSQNPLTPSMFFQKSNSLGMVLSQSDYGEEIILEDNGEEVILDDNTPESNSSESKKPPKVSSVYFSGNLFMVFFRDSVSGWGATTVIDVAGSSNESDLSPNYMGGWSEKCKETRADQPGEESYYPCAQEALMISAKFL